MIQILSAIKNKDVTAVEVLTAFMKRAAIAHQLLCCLTQISFEEGLARAKELDDYYERTGELAGPLHGGIISVIHCVEHELTWLLHYRASDQCQSQQTLNSSLLI